MKNIWELVSNIGVDDQVSSTVLWKIRLLNQMALLALVLQVFSLLILLVNFHWVFLSISLSPIPLYLFIWWLQAKKKYILARWVMILSSNFLVFLYNFTFGNLLGITSALLAIILLDLIFFDKKWHIRIQISIVTLTYAACNYSNYYHTPPFGELVVPAVSFIIFFILAAAVIIVIKLFVDELSLQQRKQDQLLIALRKKQKQLEGSKLLIMKQNMNLQKSNEELERFAYVASHDLKAPLRNLTNYLSLIKARMDKLSTDKLLQYVNIALRSGQEMFDNIEDLLEYARLSEEKKIEKLNLGEVIKEVLFKFDAQMKAKNATVFIPENMPRIDGNRRQLSSLFQNLIENGLKYNDSEKPNIQINWERQEDAHLIRIKDNGIGIKPEHQKKVFEMFKRLHDRSKYKGSGIGLAICKKIVEEHQGEIWIEENPDGGSTFALRFKATSIVAPQTKERLLSLTL